MQFNPRAVIHRWLRFRHRGTCAFGTLDSGVITVHRGDIFTCPEVTSKCIELTAVQLLTPTQPTKMLGLWNNFAAPDIRQNFNRSPEPLYFMKGENSFLASGGTIRKPPSYDGRIVFEGELGIVIGKKCRCISEEEAKNYIFGYTCVNDVTAIDVINRYPAFPQWTRAKGYDTFGAFGPVVATGLDPDELTVCTLCNGEARQNYQTSSMIFKPYRLISMLSHDMTLVPGDVIACGTSVGAGCMEPGSTVEIVIDGIGTLRNCFQ